MTSTVINSTYDMGNTSFINQSSNVLNNVYFEVPYLILIIMLGKHQLFIINSYQVGGHNIPKSG